MTRVLSVQVITDNTSARDDQSNCRSVCNVITSSFTSRDCDDGCTASFMSKSCLIAERYVISHSLTLRVLHEFLSIRPVSVFFISIWWPLLLLISKKTQLEARKAQRLSGRVDLTVLTYPCHWRPSFLLRSYYRPISISEYRICIPYVYLLNISNVDIPPILLICYPFLLYVSSENWDLQKQALLWVQFEF